MIFAKKTSAKKTSAKKTFLRICKIEFIFLYLRKNIKNTPYNI